MLRDVFYYGAKPNAHPREKFAKNLEEARSLATTEHFWIINEFCDYTNFEWEFDFDFLPDEEVWSENHINVWPSVYQKDSGTWLVANNDSELIIYRNDVERLSRKNIKTDNWKLLDKVNENKFDFGWHPDPTDPPFIYRWGNKFYPVELSASVEYHVPGATAVKYMKTVAELLPDYECWDIPDYIDRNSFDFSWRPDPREPALIYDFGTQWHRSGGPRYICEGATEVKYVDGMRAKALPRPNDSNWHTVEGITLQHFDYTWYPDPTDPPYIYVFGNQWHKAEIMPTMEYRVPGGTEVKYVHDCWGTLAPNFESWEIPDNIDINSFDFSWIPNPYDPPYIYQFGTQWQKTGGPRYLTADATEIKYVDDVKAKALVSHTNWVVPDNVELDSFDFSWHPDTTEEGYIYQFGTQWGKEGGPAYVTPGATLKKYISDQKSKASVDMARWRIPNDIDITDFDFSWRPDVEDQPYIYQFGTQHQKTGGPRYVSVGAADSSIVKYVDILKAKKLPDMSKFKVLTDKELASFDFSWHPDDTDPPYIYVFGNQHYDAEVYPTIEYAVEGATHKKYVKDIKAKLKVDKSNWVIPENIDDTEFDYSWVPHPNDPPYIYVAGTQHQKTGGPKYIVENATELKYLPAKVKKLEDNSKFEILDNAVIKSFDYSWHPDETEPAYIYQFGNNLYDAATMPTIQYVVTGAVDIKYIDEYKAILGQNKPRWVVPENIDDTGFDYSWVPNPKEPPYIYRFGTQWQKTGGPTYIVETATEIKYVEGSKAKMLSNKDDPKWDIPDNIDVSDFDFSWHPDTTERPYIYQFGTQWQKTDGPRYVIPGATTVKYIEEVKAKALPTGENWEIPEDIDLDSFDFSWHPDATIEKPYIYQFGTQWQKTGGPRYIVPGATDNAETLYVSRDVQKALKLPSKKNWTIPKNVDASTVDYSWHPDDTEPPYIYEFSTVWNDRGGPIYTVPGATHYKYVTTIKAKTISDKNNWDALLPIDEDKFDYTWVPHPNDPPYIYVFGNQWNKAEIEPTMEYMVKGATQIKYVQNVIVPVAADKRAWTILHHVDEDSFDFSWRPNPKDPAYIYVFGNDRYSAEKMPTLEYRIEGATEYKYINNIKAKLKPDMDKWEELIPVDKNKFDFSWIPDPGDPPFIYVFGNQWHKAEVEPTLRYVVSGATEIKYVDDVIAYTVADMTKWVIPDNIDSDSFDFTWRPDPHSPPYVYEFATQWNNRGGPKYIVQGAIDNKYIENIKAKTKVSKKNWYVADNIDVSDFDFSWVPHPEAPPYIYQFGTLVNDDDGPAYINPNNNGEVVRLPRVYRTNDYKEVDIEDTKWNTTVQVYPLKTTLEDLVNEHPDEVFWAIRDNIDYSKFDFSWRPSIEQVRYVHVFGSPEYKLTQTYFVSAPMYKQGHTDFNFVEGDKQVDEDYLSTLFEPNDMFLVDKGNPEARERFEKLKQKFPNIQKTRFLNSWVDTISRCINRSNTDLCWILNSELDYTGFNFNYYPNEYQLKMVHVFGTQWSHWGTTFMVNRDTFAEDTKYINVIEHLNNLNFVKDRKAIATNNLYDIVLIDHGNKQVDDVKALLETKACGKKITVIKYDKSYLNTFKSFIKTIPEKKDNFIWICSSICDYSTFDFTHITDPFARDNLHVFASDQQKFGDTFLVDVNTMKNVIDELEKLQQYPKVSYTGHLKSRRINPPVIDVNQDTHVGALNVEFDFPYMIFATENISAKDDEPINLWEEDTKNIIVTSTGASRIIVPREAKDVVKKELYDYPYIKTASKLSKSKPLDIVFLSNGELCADENYQHLLAVTKGLGNRVVRVGGVDGRVQGYHAALEASETPWAFTVFAKLKVNNKFDWNWQPDRLQIPKHYIFNATNPLNKLVYGHQAMIAYNKKLTLANTGKGLDFTLDDPHESVDLLSGIATFNTDPYSTWRTAFREVIKLQSDYSGIAEERLNTWLTVAEGEFAEDCLRGANDAVEFYDSVMGDIEELKKSYEWAWLREFYKKKYK